MELKLVVLHRVRHISIYLNSSLCPCLQASRVAHAIHHCFSVVCYKQLVDDWSCITFLQN